jgi:chromosomal replication initiation ATPase DnaA
MLAEIVVLEANRLDLSVRDLRADCRKPALVRARWRIAEAARAVPHPEYPAQPRFSLPEIGRALNRDHTTILHGLRKVGAA